MSRPGNADVIVIGGGFAGLVTALFVARRGHSVSLVERDAAPTGRTAEDDVYRWRRPGVPQSAQSHLILASARRILLDEAPDVVEALIQRGVRETPVRVGAGEMPGESFLMARRPVAEGVLRRIVEAEPGVTVIIGAVVGLLASANRSRSATSGDAVLVTGVRLAGGTVLSAPLVVDCGGRRSALPDWLVEAGARPPVERSQSCGFFYATRYYRTRPGKTPPVTRIPASLPLDYANLLAAEADNGTFSVTATLSVDDPLRARIRVPELHARFMASVPFTAAWVAVGDPITDIATMSRIENRHRALVDSHGPVVTGLVAVGDAALHTNPTLGRGICIAAAHGQHLAEVLGQGDDPDSFAQQFHEWTQQHLVGWFDSQVTADVATLQRLAAGLRGERVPPPNDPQGTVLAGAFACAQHDRVVGAALAAVAHMFTPPSVALADPEVAERIRRHIAATPAPERPLDVPTRAQFEAVMA